ncbi:MAG TPA: phage holin family protein [Flavobacterium sp.]|nr:phage holin family protein [Flavobacterium sp.]
MDNFIKISTAGTGTFITYLFGGIDQAFLILLLFIACDYLTGVIAGWYNQRLSSANGLRGIVKKVLLLILIVVADKIDILMGLNNITRSAVIYFLIANEGLSILENLGRSGITIPDFLKKGLEQMNSPQEKKEE